MQGRKKRVRASQKPTPGIQKALEQAIYLMNTGQSVAARNLLGELASVEAARPDALHLLGLMAAQAGRAEEGAQLIGEAVQLRPKVAFYRYNLGNTLLQASHVEEAVAALRQALRLDPRMPEAHNNLGNALGTLGDMDAAIQHYRRAIQLRPDYADAHNNLGHTLAQRGDGDTGIASIRRALALNPDSFSARVNLGAALLLNDRAGEAVDEYRTALALRPSDPTAMTSLGKALFLSGDREGARDTLERALELEPDATEALLCLGDVHNGLGDAQRARSCFERLLKVDPDNADGHARLGRLYANLGRFEDAANHYRRHIELDPGAMGSRAGLSHMRASGDEATDTRELIALANNPELPGEERAKLHFALGRGFDRRGEYAEAFSHYATGNELRQVAWAPERHSLQVNELMDLFTPGFLESRRGWGSESTRPLFIVGMPRSGTTLAEQILASHPEVFGAGELEFFTQLATRLMTASDGGLAGALGSLDRDAVQGLADGYLAELQRYSPDARFVTDKMPGNFLYLGLIALLFPGARIVHCRRDPLDTGLSIYFQYFNAKSHPYAWDLGHIGAYYRDYLRLMEHWQRVLPEERILDLDYEVLVDDLEGQTRRLLKFVGLPWDERCLAFHETERVVKTASLWQVRQPLYRGSLQRWRHYQAYLGPLRKALGDREGGSPEHGL